MVRRLGVPALLLALALVATTSGAAVYDDSWCRTSSVAWASDACAGRLWGLANIKAPDAWSVTKGAGVTVAVIDTGADFNHPDLAPNLVSVQGSDLTKSNEAIYPFL